MESPSPIDNPADFAVWQEGYLAAVNEKLATWTGPSIPFAGGGIDFQRANITVGIDDDSVIASYQFVWQGLMMVTKTYVYDDGQGNKFTASLTYTTPDSPWFDTSLGYNETDQDTAVGACYEWTDSLAQHSSEKFSAWFLPNSQEFAGLDSIRRMLAGIGDAADREVVSHLRLVRTKP
jgi:hypothetical protein